MNISVNFQLPNQHRFLAIMHEYKKRDFFCLSAHRLKGGRCKEFCVLQPPTHVLQNIIWIDEYEYVLLDSVIGSRNPSNGSCFVF